MKRFSLCLVVLIVFLSARECSAEAGKLFTPVPGHGAETTSHQVVLKKKKKQACTELGGECEKLKECCSDATYCSFAVGCSLGTKCCN
jgi:hypothetical protein